MSSCFTTWTCRRWKSNYCRANSKHLAKGTGEILMKKAEEQLTDYYEIKSPKSLYEIADSLKCFLRKGLIKEIPGTCSVFDISVGQPLPNDLINIEFETIPSGTRYLLSCDTYHGAGGVFKRL
jgi:hypothetical protein